MKLPELPSIVWVILLPLGLIPFIGGLLLCLHSWPPLKERHIIGVRFVEYVLIGYAIILINRILIMRKSSLASVSSPTCLPAFGGIGDPLLINWIPPS